MRVLITGGAGFIGSRLALALLKNNINVTVMDILDKQIHGLDVDSSYTYNLIKDKCKFIRGDVRRKEDWVRSLDGVNIIIHMASKTGTGQSMYQNSDYFDHNVIGTSVMLDVLTEINHGVEKIILASSRAVYGEGKYKCSNHGYIYPQERCTNITDTKDFEIHCPICNNIAIFGPTDELSLLSSKSTYALTKEVQEKALKIFHTITKMPIIVYRFQNVFGPGQSLNNPYTGILSIFSTRLFNNKDVFIFEDGKESRDFVYIDDVVEAVMLGIRYETPHYHIFNVGSGKSTNVLKVAESIKANLNSSSNIIVTNKSRLGDIRHNVADIGKINETLGFKPKYNFEDGLKIFLEWVNTQDLNTDLYEDSLQDLRNKGLYK